MEYRTLRESELEQWFDHCVYVFNEGQYDEVFRNRFVNHYYQDPTASLERIFVAVDDGEIASTVRIFKREIFIEDTLLSMGGIGEVSTKPQYRGQGIASKLMKMAIEKMKEEHLEISLLGTGVPSFYEKLGWKSIIMYYHVHEVSKHENFTYHIRKMDYEKDWKAIKELHDFYVRKINGSVNRNEDIYWQQWIKTENPQGWVVEDSNSQLEAYVFGEVENDIFIVKEYGAKNELIFDDVIKVICQLNYVDKVQMPAFLSTSSFEKIEEKTNGGWMIRLNKTIDISGTKITTTEQLVQLLNSKVNKLHYLEVDGF
ncbi:MAG: enhanced intracellular survival protein Eis [Bacillaceae bacterium]